MGPAEQFYPARHALESHYGASEYHLKSLFSVPALRAWGSARAGKPLMLADVGCGKGLFLKEFTQEVRRRWQIQEIEATGIDLVRTEDNYFAEVSKRFTFIQQSLDGHPLPLASGSQDFVCCNHVLEHLFETEKLVREFRRVLHPQGLCLISVPNLAAWVNRALLLFASQPLGSEVGTEKVWYGRWPALELRKERLERFFPSGHIRDFTPRSLRDLTQYCGFEPVGWWAQSRGIVARLNKWAGRWIGILLKPAAG
jgi:SAM-dependent methyltransferase